MLNELLSQLRRYDMLKDCRQVVCAVSGGADSMALLWAMYLLREKLGITLWAAHFNHGLRGEESQRDEDFVREFCSRYDIPLHVGSGKVVAGKKGLEAAARDARYAFLQTLPGVILTAHTADDNAETVLMHMVRGTGLKGLGGIAPVNGRVLRPMLSCTRAQVLSFLQEYHIGFVEDSSNCGDDFLRNRLRHSVMPLLKQENPSLAENLSAMAMSLRDDEEALARQAQYDVLPAVSQLKAMPGAVRSRVLERFLKENNVKEPQRSHILLAEELIFSENPSAQGHFPGGIRLRRNYDRLECVRDIAPPEAVVLPENGQVRFGDVQIICRRAQQIENTKDVITVCPKGTVVVRCRQSGDAMALPGGSKLLKKLFIDKKIPAAQRLQIPVIADEHGVLGVCGVGVNLSRAADSLPALQIRFITEK